MFKGYKPPGMTPWSEGGTRVPREGAQSGVEIKGPTQHSKGEALIQTQDGWLDARMLYTVAVIVGPGMDSSKQLAGESFGAALLAKRGRTLESFSKSELDLTITTEIT